jgi:hypothetical protein
MQDMLDLIEKAFPSFIQINTWQELCREWVLRASGQQALPVAVEEVGSEWAKNFVIDVVGLSKAESSLVLGDCYWGESPMGVAAIDELAQKTAVIIPKKDDSWTVYYVLFSAAGWTEEAHAQAEEIVAERQANRRKRWQSVGVKLLDLEELDADLVRWSL